MKRVALIFATDSEGKLLLGKRRDNGHYTLPGGHLNEGEDPYAGAARELKEETGLTALDDVMELSDERELNGVKFFTFSCGVDGTPTGKNDPDNECGIWAYFDVSKGVPKEVAENLQGPKDKEDNIVTDYFGLAKMQRMPGFPKLGVDDRREVPLIQTSNQAKLKGLQVSWALRQQFPNENKRDMDQYGHNIVADTHGASVAGAQGINTSFTHSNDSIKRFHPKIKTSNNSDLGTQLHEGFHEMMNNVQRKHGASARDTLAHNLWNSIPYTPGLWHGAYGNFVSEHLPPERQPEENIASMHNYLNDPAERERFHAKDSDAMRKEALGSMKQAFKHLIDMSKRVDNRWLKKKMSRQQVNELVRGTPEKKPSFSVPPPEARPTTTPGKLKPAKRAPMPSRQLDLLKAEEQDEVMRMLAMPNRDERRMALKLGTVHDKHLLRAFYDEDPEVKLAALNHPAMSHESLMGLMHMPHSESMQMLGMTHPQFNRGHLRALYDTHAKNPSPAIIDAITAHDKLYPELMEKLHQTGHATRALINRKDVPASIIHETIAKHFVPGHDQKGPHRHLVMAALKNPQAPHELVEKAIKEGDEGIKLAAAASSSLSPSVAEDILKRGHTSAENPTLRSALVRSPFATERHLNLGVEDLHPLVRAAVFGTESPFLSSKHVDRAIERGHLHDIVSALKSKAAKPEHIYKLAQHKDPKISALFTAYQNKSAVKKFEASVGGWLKNNSLTKSNLNGADTNSDIVKDMLGYNHHLMSTFNAAKFLIAGNTPTIEQVRKALWQHDGDPDKAALSAHGLEPHEGNLRALRAVRDLRQHKKSDIDQVQAQSITAGAPEAQNTAEAIENAFKDRFVFPITLGGKHSDGSMLARDMKSGQTFLLKPGSGGQSPAAGDHDDPVSQSRREAVFWHIADVWGLGDYLPRTDLVIIDGKEYACMHLLPWKFKTLDKLKTDDPTIITKILHPYLQSGVIHKWAVLDFVLGNPDRHANNIMADDTGDTPQAEVKLIDHGSALAGNHFDPANDENSFVPYYLRAWVIGPFNSLSTQDKLKVMPRVDDHVSEELHEWVSQIHAHDIQTRLLRYGIDPEPTMARLAKLKVMMSELPVDLAINKLWVTT